MRLWEPHNRIERLLREWNVSVEETKETETSLLAFGRRGDVPVVLKVQRVAGDEWNSGQVLKAFDGQGVVRAYAWSKGAVLLERALPGHSLLSLVLTGRDDAATDILAGAIGNLRTSDPPEGTATVEDWARGFDRYLYGSDGQIPRDLVRKARDLYLYLCETQSERRLLHGDLHHENVLFDTTRGWLAIDPKGVVGEAEYEIGAALRNPLGSPEFFTSQDVIRRRTSRYSKALRLNAGRIAQWAFAQAVLSAIWKWEDGVAVDPLDPTLKFASEIQRLEQVIGEFPSRLGPR